MDIKFKETCNNCKFYDDKEVICRKTGEDVMDCVGYPVPQLSCCELRDDRKSSVI